MIGYILLGSLVFGCLLGAFIVMALRRAVRTATLSSPTPAEAKIHVRAELEREHLPKPDPGAVHAMSDKEIEDAANDRAPLVSPRK